MTKRVEAGIRVKSPLTELENEVMQAVWNAGTCTVEAVHQVEGQGYAADQVDQRGAAHRLSVDTWAVAVCIGVPSNHYDAADLAFDDDVSVRGVAKSLTHPIASWNAP